MRVTYWSGATLGVTVGVVALVVFLKGWGAADQGLAPTLVFDPPFVSASQPWILPGGSRTFDVRLRNLAGREAVVEELRFSCPCAQGAIAGTDRFPVRIPAGRDAPVNITVTSRHGENGPVELRFGVVGHTGDQSIDVGAMASVLFVQHVNAEPSLLTFGRIADVEKKSTATVNLWFPKDGEPPGADLQVESDDPCVTAHLNHFSSPRLSNEAGNSKMFFAQLAIDVDPRIAPERLKASVTVRSGSHELRIPVLAVVEKSPVGTDAP